MSTFSGTNTPESNSELQLAPKGGEIVERGGGADFGELKYAFEKVVTDSQPFVDQCRQNYFTRYALWNGQSSDGKKHTRAGNGNPEVLPWDGASDLRVYETDSAINRKVAMYRLGFKRANLVASPIGGDDFKRARIVSNFMRWLIHTQLPDVDREIELLANYILEKGVAVTGQFWERRQEKTLKTITVQTLQEQFGDLDVMAVMMDEQEREMVVAWLEEHYGCTKKKARKVIGELLAKGKSTVAALGPERSYPVMRAFTLDEQIFIPPDTTDIERATGIYRVEYFTPEGLRAMIASDGWDREWVEKAIDSCRGKLITLTPSEYQQPISRSLIYQQQRFSDQIGVVYAYQRLSDEDGVAGIYLTIFSPLLPPDEVQHGYAKSGLLEYAHGKYPFILFRREFLSRRLHDSRGLPEPGKSWQDAIKAHRDSRIDAASIAIIPPLGFPINRPPTEWGPGARIPERRPGEYHFMDRPHPDGLTEKSEQILSDGWKSYCGFQSSDGDPSYAVQLSQNEVDRFLSQLSKVFGQIWRLWGQYGENQVYFRVSGLPEADPLFMEKRDANEDYDFLLQFDVQSMDSEKAFDKLEQIAKIVATADRDGIVNYAEWLTTMIEAVDPTIAGRIIDPVSVGHARATKEVQETLARAYAGQDVDLKEGMPPEIAVPVIQQYVQGDPIVQQRMQNPQDLLGKRIEKLMKQAQFVATQRENARIGRLGA